MQQVGHLGLLAPRKAHIAKAVHGQQNKFKSRPKLQKSYPSETKLNLKRPPKPPKTVHVNKTSLKFVLCSKKCPRVISGSIF